MSPTTYTRDPAEAAERVRREAWGDFVPVDPAQIAHILGLQVVRASLSDDVAGALVKKPGQDPRIVVNAGDSSNRQRFTCAHELGHYIKRSEQADEYEYYDFRDSFSTTGLGPDERWANAFAASLLMPAKHVKRFRAENLSDIDMALRLGVSREALRYRLENLNLI